MLHPSLENGRWFELPAAEQLGNIGSEVGRTIKRFKENDTEKFNQALDRALELFDLTVKDPKWQNHRLKELLRSRELFCDLFFGHTYKSTFEEIEAYFTEFAIKARLNK
jgi:hypothetical protein